MKNRLLFISILFCTVTILAQKKEKISGNKVVTDVFKTLENFNAIEITDDLEVSISQTSDNGYHLKTDENLVDVVKFDILNGVLKIYTTKKITSSKELEINLTFIDISSINLTGESKLVSNNKLNFEDLSFSAFDDASFDLDMKVENAMFNLNRSTKGKLVLKGKKASMLLNENAYLKGDIAMDELEVTVNKRADMDLNGDVTNLKLVATGSSDIKAKKLKTTYTDLNASNSSDIYVNASKELKIYTQGKSNVYVYGNPEIKVDGMNDKSKIIKK